MKSNLILVLGVEEHIECSGEGGHPTPKLLAYVGPKSEYNTYDDIPLERLDETSTINDETKEITMISLFTYVPQISHQNFFIKCISIQSAYENGQVTDIYPIKVRFLAAGIAKESLEVIFILLAYTSIRTVFFTN